MPSQRIFLDRQRSQACAIRLCELVPTLITFIGRMPGMVAFGAARHVYAVAPCQLLVAEPRRSDRHSGRVRRRFLGGREEARLLSRCCRVIQETDSRRVLGLPRAYAGASHTKGGTGVAWARGNRADRKRLGEVATVPECLPGCSGFVVESESQD